MVMPPYMIRCRHVRRSPDAARHVHRQPLPAIFLPTPDALLPPLPTPTTSRRRVAAVVHCRHHIYSAMPEQTRKERGADMREARRAICRRERWRYLFCRAAAMPSALFCATDSYCRASAMMLIARLLLQRRLLFIQDSCRHAFTPVAHDFTTAPAHQNAC